MRILVVEDEAKVARALQEGLEGEHYQVAVARTGEDGFFLANAQPFDLVVLDLHLQIARPPAQHLIGAAAAQQRAAARGGQ